MSSDPRPRVVAVAGDPPAGGANHRGWLGLTVVVFVAAPDLGKWSNATKYGGIAPDAPSLVAMKLTGKI